MKVPQTVSLFHIDFYDLLPIQIEGSDAPLTSDAGLLPLRQFDERIESTQQFAAVLDDPSVGIRPWLTSVPAEASDSAKQPMGEGWRCALAGCPRRSRRILSATAVG